MNVVRGSRLRLWVGYFIYFEFTRVSSKVYQSLNIHPKQQQIGYLMIYDVI